MGTPAFAVPSLKVLLREGYDVKLVLTQPDRPIGRGQRVAFSPIKELALEHGLSVLQPEKLRGNEEVFDKIREARPDAIVVVAYGQFLPRSILDLPSFGCVNVHASLLPKYRGAAPIQWAIAQGEEVTGVSTMFMAEKMDAGPILLKAECPILPDDTAESLSPRLAALGGELLAETLRKIFDHSIQPIPQDEKLVSFAPLIKKEDGVIDWKKPAPEIARRIRGFFPWPGSTTTLEGKIVKVSEAVAIEGKAAPGLVLSCDEEGWRVGTGEGLLLIKQVQIPGRCCQPACEAARGLRCISPGSKLGE
ncbi:MAG TPA: methionyl-tRNA formyltransferase [Cyanobacteria bacterium UBA8530]|nr:methionyl-tRNA formyltransferase [Cyanobacteria bacterium UBA8530]